MSALPASKIIFDLTAVDYSTLRLPMLVMYEHPKDFPDHVVIRVWDMDTPTNIIHLSHNIPSAKAAVPPWFVEIGRSATDDPAIVTTYI